MGLCLLTNPDMRMPQAQSDHPFIHFRASLMLVGVLDPWCRGGLCAQHLDQFLANSIYPVGVLARWR